MTIDVKLFAQQSQHLHTTYNSYNITRLGKINQEIIEYYSVDYFYVQPQ